MNVVSCIYTHETFPNFRINLDEMLYCNMRIRFKAGQIVRKRRVYLSNRFVLAIRPPSRHFYLFTCPPFRLNDH